ncbi:TrmB family transcriptional regulator sugar-binding domain-containing protein [Haloferacaceae archaeon DSL9]
MDTAELRTTLEEAGLSKYQADAYQALLGLGAASATAIADACSVPTARIYDVLRDLEAKGYIETYKQGTLHARARDPDHVLSDLRTKAEQLASAADEIETRWQQPAVEGHRLSIVKRFETVFERARTQIADAETEVQLAVTPDQFLELRPELARAHDRGVIVKVSLYVEPTADADIPEMSVFEAATTAVRRRELPTPFVALVDRSTTCFAPHLGSVNQYGVIVDDHTLTYVFHWFFLTCLWEVWESIYDGRPDAPPTEYTNIRQCVRDIEPILAEGSTVEASITGYRTETGEPIELSGRIAEITYEGTATADGHVPLAQLAGRVSLKLETDDETYTIGGWGAVLEAIEATRIEVVEIDPADG